MYSRTCMRRVSGSSKVQFNFAGEEVFCFLLRGGIIDCWGSDMLAKIIDALKALVVVNHEFACQPEIMESQGRIFASTVIVDALPDKEPLLLFLHRSSRRFAESDNHFR
jgi:hypothetical protein